MIGPNPRIEERTKVMVRASIRDEGPRRDVCILDVSTRGLLATTASPPVRGDFIEIEFGGHSLVGHVKWSGQRRFGIVFQDRISVISFLSGGVGSIKLPKKRKFANVSEQVVVQTYDESRRNAMLMQLFTVGLAALFAALIIAQIIIETLGGVSMSAG